MKKIETIPFAVPGDEKIDGLLIEIWSSETN
jgi:hypothetical protein